MGKLGPMAPEANKWLGYTLLDLYESFDPLVPTGRRIWRGDAELFVVQAPGGGPRHRGEPRMTNFGFVVS